MCLPRSCSIFLSAFTSCFACVSTAACLIQCLLACLLPFLLVLAGLCWHMHKLAQRMLQLLSHCVDASHCMRCLTPRTCQQPSSGKKGWSASWCELTGNMDPFMPPTSSARESARARWPAHEADSDILTKAAANAGEAPHKCNHAIRIWEVRTPTWNLQHELFQDSMNTEPSCTIELHSLRARFALLPLLRFGPEEEVLQTRCSGLQLLILDHVLFQIAHVYSPSFLKHPFPTLATWHI